MAPEKEPPVVPINKEETKKNILQKEEIASNQEKLDNLKKVKEEAKQKKKRGVGFYLLITLVVIIIGGGVTVGIFYDQVKQHIPFLADEVKTEQSDTPSEMEKMKEMLGEDEESATEHEEEGVTGEQEEIAEEEVLQVPEVNETTVEEETPVVTPPVNNGSNNQPFHIVAGAFSSPENAARLAEKLKGMGYPAKTFLRGSMTVVSAQSYASGAEAQAALPTVKNDIPNGWILEWRN